MEWPVEGLTGTVGKMVRPLSARGTVDLAFLFVLSIAWHIARLQGIPREEGRVTARQDEESVGERFVIVL